MEEALLRIFSEWPKNRVVVKLKSRYRHGKAGINLFKAI